MKGIFRWIEEKKRLGLTCETGDEHRAGHGGRTCRLHFWWIKWLSPVPHVLHQKKDKAEKKKLFRKWSARPAAAPLHRQIHSFRPGNSPDFLKK